MNATKLTNIIEFLENFPSCIKIKHITFGRNTNGKP
jgi:hypothetical protein